MQERYKNILSLDSDKAFFVSISNYANYVWEILQEFNTLKLTLGQKVKIVSDEQDNLEAQKAFALADTYITNPEIGKDKKTKELIDKAHNFSLKFSTNVGYAWIALGNVGLLVHNREEWQELRNEWNKEVEIKKANPKYAIETKHDKLVTEIDNIILSLNPEKTTITTESKQFFTRENYINYLMLVHEFLINELKTLAKNTLISFPSGKSVVYDDKKHTLYFKLDDGMGKPEVIDFANAPTEWMLFECFWELKKQMQDDTFTVEEIVSKYKELFKKEITKFDISHCISNINKRIKNKSLLKHRFKFIPHGGKSWTILLS